MRAGFAGDRIGVALRVGVIFSRCRPCVASVEFAACLIAFRPQDGRGFVNREAQEEREFRTKSMINPNGDQFAQNNPVGGPTNPGSEQTSTDSNQSRFQDVTGRVSTAASGAWQQTKDTAGTARERTGFFLRENPVPTVIGALAVGLAIGLAIRYSSTSNEREVEIKSPLGDVNLGMLSLPFLWPFFKSVKHR